MDDLDHSIHIAEDEWTSFYEESEECSLLRPSLACLDSSSLSDSEDSGSPTYPGFNTGQHEAPPSTIANSDISQSNAMGLSMAEERCTGYIKLSVQVNQSGMGGQPHDLTLKTKEDSVLRHSAALGNDLVAQGDSEICLHYPGENMVQMETADQITEVTNYSITNVQWSDGADSISVSTDLKKGSGDVQRECGTFNLKSIQEPDPPTCDQLELNMNMPHNTERDSSVAFRTEKERWFVTVNDRPPRQKGFATSSVKKKRRKKKMNHESRNMNHSCSNGQVPLLECVSKLNKADEFEGEKDTEYVTQSYQNSGLHPSIEILPESFQRELISPQMYITSLPFGEEENVSKNLDTSRFTEAVTTEPCVDSNTCEPHSSAGSLEKPVNPPTSILHDRFTLKGENTTLLESIESEEFEEGVELFSTHSYDSENCLSTTEEEPQHLLKDTEQQPVDIKLSELCTSSPTTSDSQICVLTENASVHSMQDTEMYACDNSTLTHSQSAFKEYSPQGHTPQRSQSTADQAYVGPTVTFPSAGQNTNNTMPEDNSTSDNDTRSTISHMPLDTRELQEHESPTEFQLSASGSLVGDQLKSPPLPIPDLTVTPCSMDDSPEMCAEALGPTRPVYAISAFWDEMEKLTIKDILQLRVAASPSPSETQETARLHEDVTDPHTHDNSLVDTVDYLLPDAASIDASDTADSDYSTQPDDSKPDRSSCEFSTFSDFDEEYCQFIGASRNPSPDPHTVNQLSQTTTDSPFLTHDSQEESTNPVGKETTAALEQFAGQCFDDHASHIFLSSELACPRGITKSRSMHNVQALNTETQLKDIPLQSMLGNAEKSLFLSSCQSLEENMVTVSDSITLATITPAPILSNTDILDENYRISFPEVFEYLFTEDQTKNDSRAVAVYDSKGISVGLAYDYTLSKYRPEMSLSSLQDSQCREEKLIPIFSCSHLTVRDLTFPELDYLFFPQDMYADTEEEDNDSPIRVVSRSQANDSASTAAAPGGPAYNTKGWSGCLKSLFSIRKARFPDKDSIWCRRSGGWVFPVEAQRRANPAITLFNERRVSAFPSQFFRELAVRQRILKSVRTTVSLSKQDGFFSTLQQSDMCLVCIAVASWVLRSSDPQAADAWKAALLANVSAISAIQYLRQYVKKDPPQDEP